MAIQVEIGKNRNDFKFVVENTFEKEIIQMFYI